MSLILASFLSEIYLDLNMLPLGQKGIHVIECKIIEIRPIIYERGLYFLKRILITDFLEHYNCYHGASYISNICYFHQVFGDHILKDS